MSWEEDSNWEASWWGKVTSTGYYETTKQVITYAPRMGIIIHNDSQGPHIITKGSILDVGGGPTSMLLLAEGYDLATIVDPCEYPKWTIERYKEIGIEFIKEKGENLLEISQISSRVYTECWIYNVLQHVEDPAKIVSNIRKVSRIIRVFDWLEVGVAPGHPQNLTRDKMDEWFGGEGSVVQGKGGLQYFGIFLGNHYEDSNISS